MKILAFPWGILMANCYLLTDTPGKKCIVIDPAAPPDTVLSGFEKAPSVSYILLTHCHFDHLTYLREWKNRTGAPIVIGCADARGLTDPRLNLTDYFRQPAREEYPQADIRLSDGEAVGEDELRLTAISTPGHTAGSLCYYAPGILFSGDTIFADGGTGRTDFPSGDSRSLVGSVRRLMALSPETLVYPGHGNVTTIGMEQLHHAYQTGE